MKPKRIILIRHGESQANVDKYLFGRVPDYTIELTDLGRKLTVEEGRPLPPDHRNGTAHSPLEISMMSIGTNMFS